MPTKHQDNLDNANKNKRSGQANQAPSKTLQLFRRLRLLLCNKRMKSGDVKRLESVNVVTVNRIGGDVSPQIINDGLDFGTHKTRTMSNNDRHYFGRNCFSSKSPQAFVIVFLFPL
jgi:hypothetical protein